MGEVQVETWYLIEGWRAKHVAGWQPIHRVHSLEEAREYKDKAPLQYREIRIVEVRATRRVIDEEGG